MTSTYVEPQLLNEAIKNARFSADDLAEKMSVSRAVMTSWCDGVYQVPANFVGTMARLLGVPVDSLCKASETRVRPVGQLTQNDLTVKEDIPSLPRRRERLLFGMDGTLMLPPVRSQVRCSCGRLLNESPVNGMA